MKIYPISATYSVCVWVVASQCKSAVLRYMCTLCRQILGDKALHANIKSHTPLQILRMCDYANTQHSDPTYLQ